MTKLLISIAIIHAILVFTGVASPPGSVLYDLFTHPIDWSLDTLVLFITDSALLGITGVVIGTTFRNDLLTFAGLTTILISFGAALGELFKIIEVSLGQELAIIFVGPLAVLYLFAGVSFWRGMSD